MKRVINIALFFKVRQHRLFKNAHELAATERNLNTQTRKYSFEEKKTVAKLSVRNANSWDAKEMKLLKILFSEIFIVVWYKLLFKRQFI